MSRLVVVTALLASACGRLGFDGDSDSGVQPSCPGMTNVADEDHDLVGDPCDVCPHVADRAQADADQDAVGDACDPEPAVARQRITFFDGFNGKLPEWNIFDPPIDGQQHVDVLATDWGATLAIPTGISTVQVGGTIIAVSSPKPQLYVGSTDPTSDRLYYVELIDDGTGRRRSLMSFDNGTYDELDGFRETVPIEPGAFTIALSVAPDQLAATLDILGSPHAFAATATAPIVGMGTQLYVDRLSVVFDYAIMIETLP